MMVKTIMDKTILSEITEFINLLKEKNISIDRVILFGSYAQGHAHKNSDIDLAVVSSDFGKNEIEEMMLLSKLSCRVSDRLEAIPVSDKLMKSKYEPLIGEIKKHGQTIYIS